MPVFRPTANCIWNSFQNSGKRHLFLTGGRGTGKTTLLGELFPQKLPGITTWAEPRKAVYLADNLTQERIEIGRYDSSLPGIENKMVISSDGFKSQGIPILGKCVLDESEWVSIDEIGYLETENEDYLNAIRKLLLQKRVIALIRKQELSFLREMCKREDAFLVDLDHPFGDYGCVIMASGLGKRFGSNKLMANFDGNPLICRILDATEGFFPKRVVVTRHQDVASLCQERGIEVILHEFPYRSDTVRIGLEAIGDVSGCMFCPADQPLLRKETVAALLLSAVNNSENIWRTQFETVPGSPVLFPKWAFAELLDLPEGKGGGWVVKKHIQRVSLMNVANSSELLDVDTPDMLELLQQKYLAGEFHYD